MWIVGEVPVEVTAGRWQRENQLKARPLDKSDYVRALRQAQFCEHFLAPNKNMSAQPQTFTNLVRAQQARAKTHLPVPQF